MIKRDSLFVKQFSLILVTFLLFSGCSVVMALKQPDKKNLNVISAGFSRDDVISHIGAPATSEKTDDGKRIEIYNFTQGYSGGLKAGRALFHGVADIFTLFIWELIGMPTEAIVDGTEMSVKVTYDQDDRIEDFLYLKQS